MNEIQDVTPANAGEVDYGEESFSNDPKGEEISFDELVGVDQTAKDDGGKPIFDKNTVATIKEVKLNRQFEPKTTRDGKQEYTPIVVRVEIETVDGQKSYDNYGGLRETDSGLWAGSKSAFGKLRDLVLEELGDDATWAEIFKFLNSGIKVKVRTETTKYSGNTYQKNIVKQIL